MTFFTYLIFCIVMAVPSFSQAAWNTNVKKDSNGHLYVNGIYPLLCANDNVCLNRTSATTGEIDVGLKQALTVGKATSGTLANVGFGGPASLSDNYPILGQRTIDGDMVWWQLANPTIVGQGGAGLWLKTDNGNSDAVIQVRDVGSVAPDAYAGGGLILRTSGGSLPGIRLVADDLATANIKLYAGGNASTNLVMTVDQAGLQWGTLIAKPTCNSGARGREYFTKSGAGVADQLEMCMKSSSDTYAWVVVKAAP